MSFLRLDDYTVPGYDLNVSLSFDLKKDDASGDSSSTAKASKGAKGKRLSVSLRLRYAEAKLLRALVQVAEARQGGDGKIYTVANTTANALGVRQAAFIDKFQVTPQQSRNEWLVTFSLAEHNSVPEMTERRALDPVEVVQESEGESVDSVERALTTFERILKDIDAQAGALAGARPPAPQGGGSA